MGVKALLVINTLLFISIFLLSPNLFAQQEGVPKIINEERFNRFIYSNFNKIAPHPIINKDNLRIEAFYIILKIEDLFVKDVIYSESTREEIIGRSRFPIKELNEAIKLREFQFSNIDQLVIPILMSWIQSNSKIEDFLQSVQNLIPKSGYTKDSFIVDPVIIKLGTPIKN